MLTYVRLRPWGRSASRRREIEREEISIEKLRRMLGR